MTLLTKFSLAYSDLLVGPKGAESLTAEGADALPEGAVGCWGHAVTMARSRALTGPYELHPDVHILTSRNRFKIHAKKTDRTDNQRKRGNHLPVLCGN